MLVTKHKSKVVDAKDPTKHEWLCPGELMGVKRVIDDYVRRARGHAQVPMWGCKIEYHDRQYDYSLQTLWMNIWNDIIIKTPWMKGNFQYRISQKAFLSVITHHSNLSRLPNTTKQQNPSNNLSSWANQGPTAKPGCSCQAPQGHSKSFEMKTAVAWMVGSFDSKLSFKIIIIFYISSFGMPTFLGTFEVLPLESVKGAQLQLWNQIDYRDI